MKRLRSLLGIMVVIVTLLLITGCGWERPPDDAIHTMIIHPRFVGECWSTLFMRPDYFRGTSEPVMWVQFSNRDLFHAFGPIGGPFQFPSQRDEIIQFQGGRPEVPGFRRLLYHVSRWGQNVEQREQSFYIRTLFGFNYTSIYSLSRPSFRQIGWLIRSNEATLKSGTFNYLRFTYSIYNMPMVHFYLDVSSHEEGQTLHWRQPCEDKLFPSN